jgi:small subunit ribosomal protein S6
MQYEITYILKPELTTEEQIAVGDFISQKIITLKGKAQKAMRTFSTERGGTDENNLRRFAYPIRHYRQGYYYTMVFEVKESALAGIEKQLRQNEKILRFLIVKEFTPLTEVAVAVVATDTKTPMTKTEEVLHEVEAETSKKNSKPTKKTPQKTLSTVADQEKTTSDEDIQEKVAQLDEELDKILE